MRSRCKRVERNASKCDKRVDQRNRETWSKSKVCGCVWPNEQQNVRGMHREAANNEETTWQRECRRGTCKSIINRIVTYAANVGNGRVNAITTTGKQCRALQREMKLNTATNAWNACVNVEQQEQGRCVQVKRGNNGVDRNVASPFSM